MQNKTAVILVLCAALSMAGCQSAQQSMDSAYVTCASSGMQPGSWQHERCTRNVYAENQRKSDEAAAAVAVGVAAGAVGAYAISQAAKDDRKDWDHRHRPRSRW
jgi:outer membrane lipoprotein SlyB